MAEPLLEFILRQLEQFPQAALLGRELREKNEEEFDLLCKQRLLSRLPLNTHRLYPCPSKDCCEAPGRIVNRSQGKLWATCECPAAEPDFEIQPSDLAEFRFDYSSFAEAMQSAGDLSGRVETLSERFTLVGEKLLDSKRMAVVLAFLSDSPESPALVAGVRNMLPTGFDKILVVTPTYQPAARDLADLERLGILLATGLRIPDFRLPGSDVAARTDELSIDFDKFAVHYLDKSCELRNTKEFALFERLSRRPGQFFSIEVLIQDVWGDEFIEKNTVQRTASNLRRKLSDAGFDGVEIDGTTNRGHYALKLAGQ